ncbi:lycopene cyclase family protein [Streptomyces sp. NPDC002454]|uniref:lycopene cyclase family protein n=1 Tax=Streptomyces sp. NPDC002490 TaxID=3154416 RepID=UPI0033189857
MSDADVVIVGAGAAGLSLAHRLCALGPRERPAVVLVEAPPGPRRPGERTWCYWEEPGGPYDAWLTAAWDRVRVRGADGTSTTGRTAPLRYKMLRSREFSAAVGARIAATAGVRRLTATVDRIADLPPGRAPGAEVHGTRADGSPLRLRARWVFDSRPPSAPPPARTVLLQHFRGWFVRTRRPVFRPDTVDLMDFRTPQPAHGLSFGYVLPTGARTALVEYTEFSRRVLPGADYDRALGHYLEEVLAAGPYETTGVEHGVIPMADSRPAPRAGAAVFRIGAAGGAVRPATGYAFAGIQRQTRAVAALLRAGRTPLPPPAHRARSLAMDAVLLRALDTGRIDGADFFARLFRTVPTPTLLRFLDGATRPVEDLALGLRTPVLPMLRTALELPLLRRSPSASGKAP